MTHDELVAVAVEKRRRIVAGEDWSDLVGAGSDGVGDAGDAIVTFSVLRSAVRSVAEAACGYAKAAAEDAGSQAVAATELRLDDVVRRLDELDAKVNLRFDDIVRRLAELDAKVNRALDVRVRLVGRDAAGNIERIVEVDGVASV